MLAALLAAPAWAKKPVPSAPLKAYKGPEGEVIVMVVVNDSKEMLVHFKNLGGDLEGKTLLYLFEDQGRGRKEVYLNKKRGSKTYRSIMLSARDNRWEFYHPTDPKIQFSLSYSEKATEETKLDHVLNAYQP